MMETTDARNSVTTGNKLGGDIATELPSAAFVQFHILNMYMYFILNVLGEKSLGNLGSQD
jgi:hypothetical protein